MSYGQALATAFAYSIIPIMIMIALSAIAWMLSKLLKHQQFEIFARIELYQVLVSIILITAVIFGTQTLFIITSQIAGIPGQNIFDISLNYLETLIRDVYEAFRGAFGGKMIVEFLSSIKVSIGVRDALADANHILTALPFDASITFPILDWSTFNRALDKLFVILSPFYASLIIQQFALALIKTVMIPLVLPIGLFLRIFPPTRNSGSFLIAVALGFYIVFPFTYVIHAHTVPLIYENIRNDFDNMFKFDEVPDGLSGVAVQVWNRTFGTIGGALFYIFEGIIKFSLVVLQGFFLPTLSMTFTIKFIESFQKFLIQNTG